MESHRWSANAVNAEIVPHGAVIIGIITVIETTQDIRTNCAEIRATVTAPLSSLDVIAALQPAFAISLRAFYRLRVNTAADGDYSSSAEFENAARRGRRTQIVHGATTPTLS